MCLTKWRLKKACNYLHFRFCTLPLFAACISLYGKVDTAFEQVFLDMTRVLPYNPHQSQCAIFWTRHSHSYLNWQYASFSARAQNGGSFMQAYQLKPELAKRLPVQPYKTFLLHLASVATKKTARFKQDFNTKCLQTKLYWFNQILAFLIFYLCRVCSTLTCSCMQNARHFQTLNSTLPVSFAYATKLFFGSPDTLLRCAPAHWTKFLFPIPFSCIYFFLQLLSFSFPNAAAAVYNSLL